ncbi:MAG TPA: hypothetical protein VGG83_26185 [Trebonia sp.]
MTESGRVGTVSRAGREPGGQKRARQEDNGITCVCVSAMNA